MKKRFAIILVLVQCVISVHAQDYSAPIFRGELAEKYAYNITGCVYAYSDEFETGDVMFNGKKYSGLQLNLNAHRNELQVKVGVSGDCIALRNILVGDYNIGERNYTALYGANCIAGLAEGHYQVLYKGEGLLLKKIYKHVSEQANFITGDITKVFTTKYRYYLVKGGVVYKVKDVKSLVKFDKEDKGKIRSFIKEQRRKGVKPEDIMHGVMKIMEE